MNWFTLFCWFLVAQSDLVLYIYIHILFHDGFFYKGLPDSSVGKESVCNAGDPGLIPGLERSAGEGIGYPLQYYWASLVAQLVKNLPAMSVGKESACNAGDSCSIPGSERSAGEGKGYPFLENSMDCIIREVATTKRFSLLLFTFITYLRKLE